MILAADNLQITDPVVARAVELMEPEPIRDLVRRCVAAGADAIDINPGPLKKDPKGRMRFLVETVSSVTGLPLLLDTVNPEAIAAGVEASPNPVIINGFSLEAAKMEKILPIAIDAGADIVGYLLHPDGGVPSEEEECLDLALRLLEEASSAGLDPQRLIIDPVVAPLSWENGLRRNRIVLSVIRRLPDLYGFAVRTIAGLSNLTSGAAPYRARLLMEAAFAPMLACCGLDIMLMNMFHSRTVACARACGVLTGADIFAWEEAARLCGSVDR